MLSLFYCNIWFVVFLFRRDAFCRLVTAHYLCGGDSDKQIRFEQSNISDSDCQYVEELELQIF